MSGPCQQKSRNKYPSKSEAVGNSQSLREENKENSISSQSSPCLDRLVYQGSSKSKLQVGGLKITGFPNDRAAQLKHLGKMNTLRKCNSEEVLGGRDVERKMRGEEEETIQVFVRVRPLNSQEKSKHSYSILDCPGTREVVVKERSGSNITKTFTFDRAFGPQSKQLDVYRVVVSPLLEKVMQGYNCTVFAYGQTGTGKTFTMEGERSDGSLNWSQDPMAGIVPRALGQLFDELRRQNSEFTIRVSLLELYNEELYDLLAPVEGPKLKNLRMFEDPTKKNSVTISGLEEVIVQSKSEVYQIMEKGSERRKTAATLMNAASSRSHTVLTVTVHIKESTMEGEDLLKIGKLNLVDLAGSENIGRSGAVDKRAREAGNINQSLLTLGRVITALVERAPHIPYRESKLTRILKDSLGGTTKTSIIATVSPAHINVEETLSTLEYAHRAKNITNQPTVNQRLTKHVMMSAYTEEIERLRRDLVATREKTGVWVDQKNFDETEAKLVSLQQELQQSSTHTKNLSDALEKCQADLAAKEAELADLQEEHSTVKLVLSQTSEKLRQTENSLRKTEQAKQEQEHLVEKHVLTERNLASEASTLLDTADDATLSLERLYNKLERKRAVEQTNLEAGKRLKKEIAEQLNEISDHIDVFRKDHASFCGAQRMKLDEFVDEKAEAINTFLENMNGVYNHFKNVCSESLTMVQNQNKSVLSQQNKAQGITLEKCKKSLEILNKVVGKIVDVELTEVADKLGSMQSNMDVLVIDFKNQMTSQNNEVSRYVAYNLKQLENYKKELAYIHEQQCNSNSSVCKLAQEQQDEANKYTELVHAKVKEIIDRANEIAENTSQYKESSSLSYVSLTSEIKSAEERMKAQKSKVLKSMKADKVEGVNVQSVHEKLVANIIASADEKNNSVAESAQRGLAVLQDSSNELQQQVIDSRESVSQIEIILTERQTKLKSGIDSFQHKFESLQQDVTKSTETIVTDCETRTKEFLEADTSFVKNTQDALQDHCVQIDEWSEGQRSSVYQQAGKVREFWDSTYLVDKPTGATPHRQAYSYPKTLSATSPHERIIGRFRAARSTYNDDEDRENDENF